MPIDFATAVNIVPYVTNIRKPVLFRGRHGIGKSEVVYALAENLGLQVVERRASQMTEGDLVGLPTLDGGTTTFNPPDWFAECCKGARLLFLDEVDRATIEVRQGIFELTDSRKLNGHVLHEDTLIFACVNGGEHGAQYQVGEMDPAELDRYTVFDVQPTVEDWLNWADGNVASEIWDFINQNHQHLEHNDDFEPNKVYPSRRSWVRLSNALQSMGVIKSSPVLYHLSASFIGFEGAVAFNDFVSNYKTIVTVEDILEDGKIELTKDFKINDHNALIEKFKQSKCFDQKLSKEQLKNVAEYMITLPSEIGMSFWTVIASGSEQKHNASGVHSIKLSTGGSVRDYMIEILGAKK